VYLGCVPLHLSTGRVYVGCVPLGNGHPLHIHMKLTENAYAYLSTGHVYLGCVPLLLSTGRVYLGCVPLRQPCRTRRLCCPWSTPTLTWPSTLTFNIENKVVTPSNRCHLGDYCFALLHQQPNPHKHFSSGKKHLVKCMRDTSEKGDQGGCVWRDASLRKRFKKG